jgi:hypothetical protein
MKKTILILSLIIFATSFFYNCSQKPNETQNETTKVDSTSNSKDGAKTVAEGNFVDPNQPSALAALMREMFLESEKMQEAIKADKIPVDLRSKFAAMQTLTPTDSEMITEPFGTMAKSFLKSMNKVYEEKNQVQDYNAMVQSCLACHQNQCPGPMVRIKKLLIE